MRHTDRPSRRRALLPLWATLAVLGLALSSCSSTEDSSTSNTSAEPDNQLEAEDTPVDGGKLTVAVTAETNGWNPGTSQWADAGEMVGPTMLEPLLILNPDLSFEPWLADSVEPTTPGDYTSWTIKVRPNVTFHNGEKLDAAHVARNINFYAHEAPLSSLAMDDKVDEAVAVDEMTVRVDLQVPWAAYRTVLAGGSGFIMADAMLDAEDKGATNPVGTGPFQFRSWEQDASLEVAKYEGYWQEGEPHLEEIEFLPIVDARQRVEALKAGDVDMIMTTRAADVADLKANYTVVKDWTSEKTIVMLNVLEDPAKRQNPFKSVHARRALAHATNRAELAELFGAGEQLESSTSPLIGEFAITNEESGYPLEYDPEKARQEIELYKQETGYDTFEFIFSGLANLEDQQIMQYLAQSWEEVGITATIETAEQTAYIGQMVNGGFQAAYFRNYGYLDPDSSYYFWTCETAKGLGNLSINFSQYCDDVTEEAVQTGRASDDVATRKEGYTKLVKARNEQVIDVWLFNTPYSIIAEPEVRGLNPLRERPFGNFEPKPWIWTDIWLDR